MTQEYFIMKSGRKATREGEKGIALIAVLWTLVLLSVIAAFFSLETRTEARITRNMTDNAVARAAADAGVQRAILDLLTSQYSDQYGIRRVKDRKFRSDGTVYDWQFGSSTVHISVQDELRKADLNQASEALLNALFRSVGVDPGRAAALADAVGDFRDKNNIRRIHGAEEAEYRAAGMGRGPKNARFEMIEELQEVLGMTTPIYERVAPFLTIHSIPINPKLADEQLTSIFEGLDWESFNQPPGTVYAIRAEAIGPNKAVFVRKIVVQAIADSTTPVRILTWGQG